MSDKKRRKQGGTKEGNKLTTKQLQKTILQLFQQSPDRRFTPKQIIIELGLKNNKDAVRYAIEQLQANGNLKPVQAFRLKDGATSRPPREERKGASGPKQREKVAPKEPKEPKEYPKQRERPKYVREGRADDQEVSGRVDLARSGSGYLVVEGREQDIFISERNLHGAMNGDVVTARFWTPRGRNKPEGEVLEVTARKTEHFIGTYRDGGKYGVVSPDRIEYQFDIAVFPDDTDEAEDGDKVVVEVYDWPDRPGRSPRGRVTQVLGALGSTDIEMKGILINQGFELKHSDEAIAESEAISEAISPSEVHARLDLRDVTTLTIDPVDAKDFDDAISYRRLENGRLEIGVHIADVSHYVRANSALDKEAAKSTTSVYLVDRVLPMLPERLSNGVCSLRPHEDKCTFSAMFEFDSRDIIRRTYFAKTLTHSDQRFTYGDAQDLIEGGEHELGDVVRDLNRIAGKLRQRRFRNGSIDFDSEEVRFKLDADGKPVDAYVKTRKASNMLVEDFMLLANRSVATFVAEKGKDREIPLPYRVHDEPDPEKMANLATFAAKFGIELKLDSPSAIAKSYNKLTKLAAEKPELAVLSPLAIRTMAKAEYTTDNIGHYGLAFENYAHFTSPIRRYADVLTHRVLERNLNGAEYRMDKEALESQCKHISVMERAAVKAERESTSYFQVLYIKDHIGEEFEGKVNGVIERGVFVQLDDNYCEGMVPFEHMDERFELGADRLVATGKNTGQKLQMGTGVRVRIVSADPETRRIEMQLVNIAGGRAMDGGSTDGESAARSSKSGDSTKSTSPKENRRGRGNSRRSGASQTAATEAAGSSPNGRAKPARSSGRRRGRKGSE